MRFMLLQGRLTYDDADPKMSSTQFVKLAQDLGMVQPNGNGIMLLCSTVGRQQGA
jgi:hypothetical protein